ncbi:hypothetical protein GCM10027030_00740 [Luteococcus sediminum]
MSTAGPKPKFWVWTATRSGPPGMKKYIPAIGSHNLRAAACHPASDWPTIARIPAALSIIVTVMPATLGIDVASRSTLTVNQRLGQGSGMNRPPGASIRVRCSALPA